MCKGVTGVRQTAERDTWLETARRTAREILFGRVVPPTHEPLVKLHPGCRLDAPFPLTPALSPGRGRTAGRFMVPMRAGNGVGATDEARVKLHPGCRLDAPFPLTPALSPGRGRTAGRFLGTMRAGNGVGATGE